MKKATIKIDRRKREVTVNGEVVRLTFKEFELLAMLHQANSAVVSRERIMGSVWDGSEPESGRVIDQHVARLRKKTRKYGELITTVPKVGYQVSR